MSGKMLRVYIWAAMVASLSPCITRAEVALKAADVRLPVNFISDQLVDFEIFFSNVSPDFATKVAAWSLKLNIAGGEGRAAFSPFRPSPLQRTPIEHPYFFLGANDNPDTSEPSVSRPYIPENPDAYTPSSVVALGLADVGREQGVSVGEGLLRLQAIVHAGTEGVFPLTLDPQLTALADANGEAIPHLKLVNGSITVGVPEPTGALALSPAIACGMRRPIRGRQDPHRRSHR